MRQRAPQARTAQVVFRTGVACTCVAFPNVAAQEVGLIGDKAHCMGPCSAAKQTLSSPH